MHGFQTFPDSSLEVKLWKHHLYQNPSSLIRVQGNLNAEFDNQQDVEIASTLSALNPSKIKLSLHPGVEILWRAAVWEGAGNVELNCVFKIV